MKKKLISSFDYIYLEALVNTKKDKTNSKHTVLYRTCNKFTTLGLATKKSHGKKTIFAPTVKGLATVFAIQTLASSNKNYFQFGKAHRIKEINKQMDYAKKVVNQDNNKNKTSQESKSQSVDSSASSNSNQDSNRAKASNTSTTNSAKSKNSSESPSLDSSSNSSEASQSTQKSSNASTSSSSKLSSTQSKPTSSELNPKSNSSVGNLTRVQLHHDKPVKSSSSNEANSSSASQSNSSSTIEVSSKAKVSSSSSSESSSTSSTGMRSDSFVASKVSSSAGNTSNVGTVGNTKKSKHQTTIAKVEHHIKYGNMPHSRIVHERNLKRAKEEIKAQKKQEKHDKKIAKDDKVKAKIKKLAYHVPSPKHVDKSWTKLIIAYFFFGIIWFAIWLHISNLLLATNSFWGLVWIVVSAYFTYVVVHGCNNIHRWHMREKKQGLQNVQK